MVNLSCILPHPPPCLQLRICFPPLKNTQRRWEKKLVRRWFQQAHSWTCVYFHRGGRMGNVPGVRSPPPVWLFSGLWLWTHSCVAAAFLVEVHPAVACIAFSLSFTKVLLLVNLSSPSLARWAYSKFVPKHSEPQFKQCFYEIVQHRKLRHFLFIAEGLLGKLQVRTDFLVFRNKQKWDN